MPSVRVVRTYDEYHHTTTHARMMHITIEKERVMYAAANIILLMYCWCNDFASDCRVLLSRLPEVKDTK